MNLVSYVRFFAFLSLALVADLAASTVSEFDAANLAASSTRTVSQQLGFKAAQRFTVGASGATVTSVTAIVGSGAAGTPQVSIYNDASGHPGTVVTNGTLTNPTPFTPGTTNSDTFVTNYASNRWTGNVALAANTTYWVVFEELGASAAWSVSYTSATSGALGSWVPSGYSFSFFASGNWATQNGLLRISVNTVPAVPTVTTPTNVSISATSGTLGGTIPSDRGAPVTERGIVYALTSLNSDLQIGSPGVTKVAASSTGTGVFITPVSGLMGGSDYSFAAYGTNSAGTGYSSAGTFTTLAQTSAGYDATNLTPSSTRTVSQQLGFKAAQRFTVGAGGGTVTSVIAFVGSGNAGTPKVSIYSDASGQPGTVVTNGTLTNPAPFVPGTRDSETNVITYAANMWTGNVTLAASTTYWVVFEELAAQPAWSVSYSSATSGAVGAWVPGGYSFSFFANGNWSTQTGLLRISLGGTAGSAPPTSAGFDATNQAAGSTRTVSQQLGFKAAQRFTVGADGGTVTSVTAIVGSGNAGTPKVSIYSDASGQPGTVVTDGTLTNPAPFTPGTRDSNTDVINYASNRWTGNVALAANTTYWVVFEELASSVAWSVSYSNATSGAAGSWVPSGYSFSFFASGSWSTQTGLLRISLNTVPAVPTVTTPTNVSISATSATLGGTIPADRGAPVTERGIVYALTSLNSDLQIGSPGVTKVATGSTGTGVFTTPVSGLTGGSDYSFAAYATNSAGTGYSTARTFTTLAQTSAGYDATNLTPSSTRTVSQQLGFKAAQRFTVGAGGGTVTSVIAFVGSGNAGTPKVSIYSDASGQPGTVVTNGTLTNPTPFIPGTRDSETDVITYAANMWTGNVTLAANTTYWVVFEELNSSVAWSVSYSSATSGAVGAWVPSSYSFSFFANGNWSTQTGLLRVSLGGTAGSVVPAPVITSALTASGTYGSAITAYTTTASNTPTSYGATGLPPGLSIDSGTGVISGTPTSTSGSPYSVTLSATNDGGTGTANLVFTINKAGLTVSGVTANNKTYDGNTTALLNLGSATLVGVIGSDAVMIETGSAAGTFNDKTVAVGKAVAVSGIAISGANAANYSLTQPSTTANVTAKTLTATGLTVANKTYDGNTTGVPTYTGASLVGVVPGDTVALVNSSGTATFGSKTVGNNKTVTFAGLTLGGTDAGNYLLTQPTTTANITTKALTVAGVTANNKTYDGNATAALNLGSANLVGVVGSDAVTLDTGSAVAAFNDKTVATDKVVTASGLTISGADAANYSLTQPATTANITAKTITVGGITVANKTYDGNTTGTATYTGYAFTGVVGADAVTLVSSGGTATFNNKTVANSKTVTFAGLTLGGADAGNYALTQPTTTANITAKSLTVTGVTASNKTYDGTNAATLGMTSVALVGVVSGDTVALNTGSVTGAFSDPDTGGGKTVTIAGLTITGVDSANYTLMQPTTTASISQATAVVTLSNLSQTYDGQTKPVSVTVTPSIAATVLYAGSATVPTNAGTYAVTASVSNPNFSGVASGTLTIAKATQTVTLSIAGGSFTVGTSHALTATATSGGPVTFAVVAGTAPISGSSVTVTQAGSVTIRATQAGTDNYLPATADQSFTGVSAGKQDQTITFAALPNVTTQAGPFTLNASASSGLFVSYTIVSGPATISGSNLVTLNGSAGVVIIRASQAGNADFNAAPEVIRSFVVTTPPPDIFFGDLGDDPNPLDSRGELVANTGVRLDAKRGDVAAVLFAGTSRGAVAIVAPSLNLNVSLDFLLAANNQYSVPFTSNGRSLILTGSVVNGTLTGRIAALSVSFSTPAIARTGTTSSLAGIYETDAVNSATGGTTTIVSATGQVLVVTSVGTTSTGAVGTIGTNGAFSLTGTGVTIAGAVDAPTTTVSGTVTVAGQTAVQFSSLSAQASRTDRLVNLSSRVRIAPARTLITGFVIGGTASKRVLIRGVGPALTGFGVAGALTNPKLSLFDSASKLVVENDDWSGTETSAAFAQVGAFALSAGSKDAAILTTLTPGAYTVQMTAGAETGTGLVEIYDASTAAGAETQRLVNISTRGSVEVGSDGLLIGGFVVTGNVPKKVLIRAVGPGLANFGVTGTLVDPELTVFSGSKVIARNDDWSTPAPLTAEQGTASAAELAAAAQSVGAFGLTANSKDSALVITLAPGAYTAQISGANGATGTAIVEVYELP